MQGFREDYELTFVMLSGLLVVVMICILLFLHNQWSWAMQEKTVHLINLFYLDSAVIYNEEEVDFPASWKVLLQKEENSSLFSSCTGTILSFCVEPDPRK